MGNHQLCTGYCTCPSWLPGRCSLLGSRSRTGHQHAPPVATASRRLERWALASVTLASRLRMTISRGGVECKQLFAPSPDPGPAWASDQPSSEGARGCGPAGAGEASLEAFALGIEQALDLSRCRWRSFKRAIPQLNRDQPGCCRDKG